jgi:hypothetical protein
MYIHLRLPKNLLISNQLKHRQLLFALLPQQLYPHPTVFAKSMNHKEIKYFLNLLGNFLEQKLFYFFST